MKRIRLLWLNGLLLIPLAISSAVPEGPTASLSVKGQKIIDYLVEDWDSKFHSTTIPHAMENLGLPVDDGLRLEIIAHLRANPKLSRNLRFWGANNYLLTNNERRTAKLLLNAWRDDQDLPTLKSASKTLGLTEMEVAAMLAFMAQAGFLTADGDSDLGYSLAEDAALWGGPLRHNYHTIHVAGGDKFDVWWAVDFLLLVSGNNFGSGATIRLEDSCAHGTDLITLEITDGKITRLDPPTAYVQQGGGWAVDNLFSSEEHLSEWLDQYPEYKNLKHQSVADFLAGRK